MLADLRVSVASTSLQGDPRFSAFMARLEDAEMKKEVLFVVLLSFGTTRAVEAAGEACAQARDIVAEVVTQYSGGSPNHAAVLERLKTGCTSRAPRWEMPGSIRTVAPKLSACNARHRSSRIGPSSPGFRTSLVR